MRWIRGTFAVVTAVAVVGLLALNWRAQLQTQQKLDALAATLAVRQAEPAPAPQTAIPEPGRVPRELDKVATPPYIIEAPDLLSIEVVVRDPKTGTKDRLPTQPVSGSFPVRPDGTVGLGAWGSVYVAGLTLGQASDAVRVHIAKRVAEVPADRLAVTVDLFANNSKRFFVISKFAGAAEQVSALPLTGSETVLDAIRLIGGLSERGQKLVIQIERKGPGWGLSQVLPVDWEGITQHGLTHTNYQILPGDRVYVTRAAD
ncbi:MAG TPA: polysaccharide biosynthesis/export family protein [Gemmata sp.]